MNPDRKRVLEINRHAVFINAPVELVGPQAVLWGEAGWWPKKCPMRFSRESQGPVQPGTKFRQVLAVPMRPVWTSEVTKYVPGHRIEWVFRDGMFEGFEVVRVQKRGGGTQVEHQFHFRLRKFFDRFLWLVLFRRMHDWNISVTLMSLKKAMESRQTSGTEKRMEIL